MKRWIIRWSLLLLAVILLIVAARVELYRRSLLPNAEEREQVEAELSRVHTDAERCAYLESVFAADQHPRLIEVSPNGYPSEAARTRAMMDVNRLNSHRIDRYLRLFGHPQRSACSELAVIAPWTVLHHSIDDALRTRWTPVLIEAYQKGDLEADHVAWFLKRSYQTRYGADFEQGDHTHQEVIEELTRVLMPK